MNHLHNLKDKLESPERLSELSPEETLKRIGLGENDVVCDIGAGTGVFTIPAAQITKNSVFALDKNDELLEIIQQKARDKELANIKTVKVINNSFDIEDNSADFVILVTVLHEIEDKDAFLTEIKRIMKSTGRLSIIEFHRKAPMGPPDALRLEVDEVSAMCSRVGLTLVDEFDIGSNFYCVVLNA